MKEGLSENIFIIRKKMSGSDAAATATLAAVETNPAIPSSGWPSTLKKIRIYNSSRVTQELNSILLATIKEQVPFPQKVKMTQKFIYNSDKILYIIICPGGIHYTFGQTDQLPKYYINWQLEFFNEKDKVFFQPRYMDVIKRALANWDYSEYNIKMVKKHLDLDFGYVPIGFHESCCRSDLTYGLYDYTDKGKQWDILFIGWIDTHPRRVEMKKRMLEKKIKIRFETHLTFEQIKEAIKTAKICINFHAGDKFILQTTRLNLLLSNQTCIVSEWALDEDVCNEYKDGGVTFCDYDEIIPTCMSLLADFPKRKALAEKSYYWYRREMRFADINDFSPEGGLLPNLADLS